MDEDLGRYISAAGWKPRDPYKKLREKVRKEQEKFDELTRPILHSPYGDEVDPPEQLFTTLWQTGEVALLFGEPGIGKTLYAVRLAEAIATGHELDEADSSAGDWSAGVSPALQNPALQNPALQNPALQKPVLQKPARSKGMKVLYIDLQRTESQWNQRFSNTAFERRHFDWNLFHSDEDDKIRASRIQCSIEEMVEDGAEVVILDDLTLGGINLCRPNGPFRTLRALKYLAAIYPVSILVIAGARARKRPRPASLADVAFRHIADQADSVFCLSRSTYGPAFRYVRHLRSASAPIVHDASAVLTFQLEQSQIKYLGTSTEEVHLIDYVAEAMKADRADKRQLRRQWKRSSKEILVDGMMDGSYLRYLKG